RPDTRPGPQARPAAEEKPNADRGGGEPVLGREPRGPGGSAETGSPGGRSGRGGLRRADGAAPGGLRRARARRRVPDLEGCQPAPGGPLGRYAVERRTAKRPRGGRWPSRSRSGGTPDARARLAQRQKKAALTESPDGVSMHVVLAAGICSAG